MWTLGYSETKGYKQAVFVPTTFQRNMFLEIKRKKRSVTLISGRHDIDEFNLMKGNHPVNH